MATLQPTFRRYKYQGGGKKRIELKPEERVVYKLFVEVDLDTHKELKARAREAGVGSMRLGGQMIRKCLDDLEKVNGPIES